MRSNRGLKKKADTARVRKFRAAVRSEGGQAHDLSGPSFRTVYQVAEREYQPTGQLNAPVLLIRAGGDGLEHLDDIPLIRIFRDPLFSWAVRVTGGAGSIKVVDVPGGHGGMLQEPNVAAIAGPLRVALDRVTVAELSR